MRRFLGQPAGAAGLAIVLLVALAGALAPFLAPGDPLAITGPALRPPFEDWAHPLGTDQLGRDVLAGVIHGARVSLVIGVVSAAMALLIGVLVGAVAGYFGGWTDEALMRLTEAFQIVPSFVMALALVAVLGPQVSNVVIAVALVSWTQTARIVRAEYLSLRRRDFVDAYRVMGMSAPEIIFRQILPHATASIMVLASVVVATAILIESALSFLGLGDPNLVSWGGMIAGGRAVLRSAWYLSAIPGVAIVLTVLGVSLAGDALTAALMPGRRL